MTLTIVMPSGRSNINYIKLYNVQCDLHKTLENTNYSKGTKSRWGKAIEKGRRKLLRVMDKFMILIEMMVSWMYSCVQTWYTV